MRLSRFFSNAKGLSLIGALVSICIVSIMALTVMNLVGIAGNILNTFDISIRAMDAAQEVRFALTDTQTCSLNFNNVNLTGSTKAKPVKLAENLAYPDPNNKNALSDKGVVSIDNSEGEQLRLDGIYVFASPSVNLAYVEIRLRKETTHEGAPPSHVRSMPMWVQTNAAGKITCCTTLNMAACPL